MGWLMAIDPGVITGVALFEGTELSAVDLLNTKKIDYLSCLDSFMQKTDALVIEKPQIYDRKHWKGDPNNLIVLAMLVGEYTCLAKRLHIPVYRFFPRQWKGQRSKTADHIHTKRMLTDKELIIINSAKSRTQKSYFHNIMDAVGIGLYSLGRYQ